MKTRQQYAKQAAKRRFWRDVEEASPMIFVCLVLVATAVSAFAVTFGPHL